MFSTILALGLIGQSCSSGACGASAYARAYAAPQQTYALQAIQPAPVMIIAPVAPQASYSRSYSYSETGYGLAPSAAYGYEREAKTRRGLFGRRRAARGW